MQLRPAYPSDAVTGGCFITGRYEIDPDEQIIDLDLDLDTLPAWGRLCVSGQAVKLMNTLLGWTVDARLEAKVVDQRAVIRNLRAENKMLRDAVTSIGDALREAGVTLPELVDA